MSESNKLVFKVSNTQLEKRRQWRRQLEEGIAREQLEKGKLSESVAEVIKASLERGEPCAYYGAIGGAYNDIFQPTPNGLIYKVKNMP